MRTVPIAFTAHLIKTNAEMAFFNKTHKKGLAGNGFMNLPCARDIVEYYLCIKYNKMELYYS
jgi:hypothetical protein